MALNKAQFSKNKYYYLKEGSIDPLSIPCYEKIIVQIYGIYKDYIHS